MERASKAAYLYMDPEKEFILDVGELIVPIYKSPRYWSAPITCVIRKIDGKDPSIYLRVDRPDYGINQCFLIPVEEILNCQSGMVNENLFSRRYVSGNIKIIVDDGQEGHTPTAINLSKDNVEAMRKVYMDWSGIGG